MSATNRSPVSTALYIAGAVLYGVVFFKNAWVGDDAYILFRSLDQLLDGNGPRWNPHERVQVFTCPLWYGLLAVMGFFIRDHYLNSILLSAVCNGLLLWNLSRILPNAKNWLLAVVLLVFSQAYFDFSSSGLENPLAYCLLSFIARFYLNRQQLPARYANTGLSIAAGLLLVTRHDLLLFVLPLVTHSVYLAQRTHGNRHTSSLLLWLLSPLLLWSLFSLLYYGFLFPNTAYAKLGGLVTRAELLHRGMVYFSTSIQRDFVSIALLLAGVMIGTLHKNSRIRFLTAGIVLHLGYVFWIGGDFMRGRFFSWDVLLCVMIVLLTPLPQQPLWRLWLNTRTVCALLAMSLSAWLWQPPVFTPVVWGTKPFAQPDSMDGVTQERHFFFWFTSFKRYIEKGDALLLDHGWCQDSIEQQRLGLHVAGANTMGFRGYCLGTNDIVIDMLGITDPLLARMPKDPTHTNWRPGHFHRLLPSGYCAGIADNSNRISNPLIHDYYDKLRLLTQSSDLFSAERLHVIWAMNTGAYNETVNQIREQLLQQYSIGNGKVWQADARQNCPMITLPNEVIEQLKQTGKGGTKT